MYRYIIAHFIKKNLQHYNIYASNTGCWQCCPHNGSVHALVQFVKCITLIHLKSAYHNKIWY